jgi:hypothetical protein
MRLGTVVGVEALIRWAHPEEGLILPVSFLPYVEGSEVAIRSAGGCSPKPCPRCSAGQRSACTSRSASTSPATI